MAVREWFWLYRPVVPSRRAQAIQVVNAAWAMAARGHRVELCVQSDAPSSVVLDHFGLPPLDSLVLRTLPAATTAASLAYRAAVAAWVAKTHGRGVVLSRSWRHADRLGRWSRGRLQLVFEAHGAASVWDPSGARSAATDLERRVLGRAWGLVANCPGTLTELRRRHVRLPPATVLHNAARGGAPAPRGGEGIGLVGSLRSYKDPQTVALAAQRCGRPITWVGPTPEEIGAVVQASGGWVRAAGGVAPRDVPARLARFDVLLLPLSPGLFGQELTSPLKLWDALQSGVVLVAADTPAIRRAAPGAFVPYRPGDAGDLAAALRRACTDVDLRQRVVASARALARTWDQRAEQLEAFVDRVLP